jgi:hypothetical protein
MARQPRPQVPGRARHRTFTAKYKGKVLAAYDTAGPGEEGTILRRVCLCSSHITEWRWADEVLIDVRDGALGHLARMRWNDQDQRIWSEAIAHPPIIDEETFRRAGEMLAARGGGPAVHRPLSRFVRGTTL